MSATTVVLVVASGASWEPVALELLAARTGIVVLKRCVDVADLMAAAASGQAEVAVVGLDAPGLDAPAVEHLRRHGVHPVAIVGSDRPDAARAHAARLGIAAVVAEPELEALPDAVLAAASPGAATSAPASYDAGVLRFAEASEAPTVEGRVLAVWGPAGAPGRSTVAAAVAGALARRGRTILIDADPYGASIAQQLGILDEVSGVLAAVRLATSGLLEERFASVQRGLDARLSVITGLPRPDRWIEVRAGAIEQLLAVARAEADVVVDTGFSVEDDATRDLGTRPGRNLMTVEALEAADEVLVVGAADPVGLSRLARGLVELRESVGQVPVRVVVNRMRPTLGWSEKQIGAMVADFAGGAPVHFLPEDRPAVDRALVAGRTLLEGGESPLTRAAAGLVEAATEAVLPVQRSVAANR